MVTLVSESSYPNDIEIKTLLPEPIYFYKWGGQVGTPLTLNYSFSDASSFVMNDSYAEDFLEYEMDQLQLITCYLLLAMNFKLLVQQKRMSSIMHFKIGVTPLELILLKLMKLIQSMVKLDFIY